MNRYPTESKTLQPAERSPRSIGVLAVLTLAVVLASPHVLTAARAVVNLPVSAVAVAWGRAHGGTCDLHGDLMVTCESMHSGYSRLGTTVGNVWLYGSAGGTDRHRHEARHADQWAMFGPAFPVLYGVDCVQSECDPYRSVFERWAGLHDGGYLR